MRSKIAGAIATILVTAAAPADIVTRYDFTGNRGTTVSETPVQTASGVSVSNLIRGPGLTSGTGAPAYWDSFVSRQWAGPNGTPGPGPGDYLTLTITPQNGSTVSLDSLLIGVKGERSDRTLVLRSDLDNFTSNLGSVAFSTTAINRTMTFASPFTFSTPVTFRLITVGATQNGLRYAVTSQGGTAGLVFNGTVTAVPEPSSLALLGLTAVGTAGWYTRRRRRTGTATAAS